MDYICRMQLSLGGTTFFPGDVIPGEKILGSRVRALKTSGYIAEVTAPAVANNVIATGSANSMGVVFSHTEDGQSITTAVTAEQLQGVVDVLMRNAKDAAASLEDEVDETVLAMLKAVDSRKTVKEAAEKQLTIISSLKG